MRNDPFRDAPAGWQTVKLKHTVTACINGIWGEEPRGGPGDVVCVRVADFDRQRLRVEVRNPTLRFVPPKYRRRRLLAQGDLLLEKSGGGDQQPVGAVALYAGDRAAVCSNFIARMPVAPGFDSRYLCYLHAALYALGVNCRSIRQTTGIQNLDSEAYLSETVRVPDLPEQNRIGVFLDRKTAVLDRLMCNKQRLLHLYQERCDALISQSVIAGDDRQTWRSTRFKFVRAGVLLYGANEAAANRCEQGPRYIRITDLAGDGTLRADTFQSMPWRLAAPYLLEDGDLLFARSGATVGKAFLYRAEYGPACFASYLIRLRPDRRKILPEFLYYYTQSAAYRNQIRLHTVQATIANVSAERYGNFALPLPPLGKQRAIATALDQATSTLRRLTTATERQVARLQEYRASLIVQVITRGRGTVADRACVTV